MLLNLGNGVQVVDNHFDETVVNTISLQVRLMTKILSSVFLSNTLISVSINGDEQCRQYMSGCYIDVIFNEVCGLCMDLFLNVPRKLFG